MSEHVLDWIGAYYDGELRGDRLRRVDAHLRECAACQAELAALQDLSPRLQASPPMPASTPPEQFVAQVRLRLTPRQAPEPGARLRQAAGLWLPLGVLGLWAFSQAVMWVGGLVLLGWRGLSAQLGIDTLAFPAVGAANLLALNIWLTVAASGLVWGCLAGWWAAGNASLGTNLASPGHKAGR